MLPIEVSSIPLWRKIIETVIIVNNISISGKGRTISVLEIIVSHYANHYK